ncbi:hypothetical protein HBA54_03315 [Pelagibius litoralis]|uniref:Uncharacterized protein n=1 Tax=Pelagibius litoralis TaxID=374515 RepID=A0A967C768_9PROT|nr:hypothetical protein [Pelagibius litoralis]NIA67612.1 hypothetical protein [Pelagibius litoralis]
MLQVLQWIYGPGAESDPYYLLLHDFVVLMPWWYPYMWLGIITAVVSWRLLRRFRRNHQNRTGLKRVRSRVLRLADGPDGGLALLGAANDDHPALSGRYMAVD